MSRFDPNRDIKIDVKETQTGLHLRTVGLPRFGTSELEMIDVDAADMREAGGVLNTLAESIVNQNRKVKANERIAIRAPSGALVARFAEGTSVAASGFKQAKWLEQALARSDEYMRAELGDDTEELREAGRPFLAARVLVLAKENAASEATRAMGPMSIFLSPTRTLVEQGARETEAYVSAVSNGPF